MDAALAKLREEEIMRYIAFAALSFALLTGCSQSPKTAETSSTAPAAAGPTATVKLKDGGSFEGTVKSSDSTAITIQSPSGETRTYPMTQVTAVNYGPAAPAAAKPSPVTAAPEPKMAGSKAPATAAAREAPRPVEQVLTVPAGGTLEVRNNEAIDSQTARANQTYSAVVTQNITDDTGKVAVPKGANATLVVREAIAEGKVKGQSELVLDVQSVEVNGRTYRVETKDLVEKGKEGVGTNKRTAVFTGGGAALGGIIGAIAGGGKGAAIGAASGAAAGAGTQAITRGRAVRVPSETILKFTLEQPIQIRLVH